ncbi:MAG: hypothetical protein IJW13_03900 [Clostridia bacterium]|nr:hypothetical protein [Clostridia bacterium]
MFCKFCGKYTDNTNGVCNDCAGKSDSLTTPIVNATNNAANSGYDAKYGLSNAIAATVITAIGLILAYVAYAMALGSIASANGIFSFVTFIINVPSIILSIIGIKKGINGIGDFKFARAHNATPVATLVLGINAIACGASTLLINIANLIFAFVA